jgi:hypothetical protein
LTLGTQFALAVAVVLNLLLILAVMQARSTFGDAWDAPFAPRLWDDAIAADDTMGTMGVVTLLGQLGATVVLVVWMWRAHSAGSRLRPGDRKYSRGWTIGAWLIPLANLVLPRLVMTDIERVAVAPRQGGRVQQGWQNVRTAPVGWAWWLFLVAGTIGGRAQSSMMESAVESFDGDGAKAAYLTAAVSAGLCAAGLACAIALVGRIGARLSPDAFESSSVATASH